MIHIEPWPPSGSVSRHLKICLVYLTFRFLNIWLALQEGVVALCPTPNLDSQGNNFSLCHHPWPIQQGTSYHHMCYHQHSSWDHPTIQAPPLHHTRDTFSGECGYVGKVGGKLSASYSTCFILMKGYNEILRTGDSMGPRASLDMVVKT